jgi:hypothetical protein
MQWSFDAIACVGFGVIALLGRRRFAKAAYETVGCFVRLGSPSMYERLYLLLGLVFTLLGVLGLMGAIHFGR